MYTMLLARPAMIFALNSDAECRNSIQFFTFMLHSWGPIHPSLCNRIRCRAVVTARPSPFDAGRRDDATVNSMYDDLNVRMQMETPL